MQWNAQLCMVKRVNIFIFNQIKMLLYIKAWNVSIGICHKLIFVGIRDNQQCKFFGKVQIFNRFSSVIPTYIYLFKISNDSLEDFLYTIVLIWLLILIFIHLTAQSWAVHWISILWKNWNWSQTNRFGF